MRGGLVGCFRLYGRQEGWKDGPRGVGIGSVTASWIGRMPSLEWCAFCGTGMPLFVGIAISEAAIGPAGVRFA